MDVRRSAWWLFAPACAMFLGVPPARGAADDAEATLRGLGLEARKTHYVFADAEARVLGEYQSARRALEGAGQAGQALQQSAAMSQAAAMDAQAARALQQQIRNLQSRSYRSGGGRRGSRSRVGSGNSGALQMARAQLGAVQGEERMLKAQNLDPKKKAQLAKDAEKDRQAAVAKAKSLHAELAALIERYNQADADPAARKAVEQLARDKKTPYKIAPSQDVEHAARWVHSIVGDALPKLKHPSFAPSTTAATTTPAAAVAEDDGEAMTLSRARSLVGSLKIPAVTTRASLEHARDDALKSLDEAERALKAGESAEAPLAAASRALAAPRESAELPPDARKAAAEAAKLLDSLRTP